MLISAIANAMIPSYLFSFTLFDFVDCFFFKLKELLLLLVLVLECNFQ